MIDLVYQSTTLVYVDKPCQLVNLKLINEI